MPKRTDLKKIMIIGSGPIVIGQACEFDYSGTQACKALEEEGYEVVLINSNPATIMTDPSLAHRTYVEPITAGICEKIIARERPDALLPTVGGQTGLNTAVELAESGVLDRYGVELIGANLKAIKKAEDREQFKAAMIKIGLHVPVSGMVHNEKEAMEIVEKVGFPAIIRPSFTLGGTGGSIAYNMEEYEAKVRYALSESPTHTALIEKSLLGWKEYELEVMRDMKDNVVIICSIENFDPMGVHTGDSITIAPAQTLTDKEYQLLRDASLKIIREIGVDTGGSNIQFAVNPDNGQIMIIEMNPRVSRSSALASKATGFPIAKIAAKLAVGYTLDELRNDITRETPASFEPTLDYVITKIPRFTFEKFPQAENLLTTQMKSVGEVMAVGRTFKESFQKAIRSLELGHYGFESQIFDEKKIFRGEEVKPTVRQLEALQQAIRRPNSERIWQLGDAIRAGMSNDEIYDLTGIDPWFVDNLRQILEFESEIIAENLAQGDISRDTLVEAKKMGFSDRRLSKILDKPEEVIRKRRFETGVLPVYKVIDTCAAEFKAYTPYLYSTYEDEDESGVTNKRKIMILGGGPNRIGQGIEFDYCCVHGVMALREAGFETIMVNCNPETVSTDYDTSDKLYFEPLTHEDVLNICHREKPTGVIVQFGGQTPLKLALGLEKAGVPIIGTSPDSIDIAEDRERFKLLVEELKLLQPDNGIARSHGEAEDIAQKIGFPVVVRPSYVLGGRAMEIVHDMDDLRNYMEKAVKASPEHPVLIDKFLEDATELDVDLISDGKTTVVGAIMEHIEEAGIHSGDSACAIPPFTVKAPILEKIEKQSLQLAKALNVVGLMNIQFALAKDKVYLLEVNPRASRTVPFVSKTIGVSLAKLAARVMAGESLEKLGFTRRIEVKHVAVKEAVFPFTKFQNVDTLLGPEMRSTGEVMGIDDTFPLAFAKAQIAASTKLPRSGTIFISVKDKDKKPLLEVGRKAVELGFKILATKGTYEFFLKNDLPAQKVNKVKDGRPHIVDRMKSGEVQAVINTAEGKEAIADSFSIRRTALVQGIPYFTTVSAAQAVVQAMEGLATTGLNVKSLQEYHS